MIQGLSERQKATRWVVRLLVVFWAMFFAAPASAQTFTVSPGTVNFADTPDGGNSASKTVTVRNGTSATRTIGRITITGTHSTSFRSTTNCGSSLARNRSCTITVTFQPKLEGQLTATLNVPNSGVVGGLSTVTLNGKGLPPAPVLSVSPTSVAFGSVGTGTTSGPRTVVISNTGRGVLNFTSAPAITQAVGAGFSSTTTCLSTLAAGTSCTVNILFSPSTTGAKTATLVIRSNASPTTFNVALSGTGTTPTPVLTLSPTRATLTCSTPYGGPVFFPITASNTGTANVVLGAITFTGSGGPFFSQTNACPVPFTPGAACNIVVKFSPTGRTQRTATMTVNSNGGNRTVSLTGTCRSHPSP